MHRRAPLPGDEGSLGLLPDINDHADHYRTRAPMRLLLQLIERSLKFLFPGWGDGYDKDGTLFKIEVAFIFSLWLVGTNHFLDQVINRASSLSDDQIYCEGTSIPCPQSQQKVLHRIIKGITLLLSNRY
jgi:hypothetical protein